MTSVLQRLTYFKARLIFVRAAAAFEGKETEVKASEI